MKKIFQVLILILSLFLLVGCDMLNKKDDELILAREEAREYIVTMIETFGPVEDEDLEWPEDDYGYIQGKARLVVALDDDSINLLMYEDNVMIMLEFVLDESTRQSIKVWNIMITYTNMEEEIYIYLDYYHYGKLFVDDYAGEDFDIGYKDFGDMLYLLTLEDIAWILNELGYDEIQDTIELSFEQKIENLRWR